MTGKGDKAKGGQLGEMELIAQYFAPLAAAAPGSLGLTDDAALIECRTGRNLIVTMDALVAGVHFFADDAPEDIAWKALAVNVSDLAAKAARPACYTLALMLPAAPERDWIEAFAAGLGEAQAAFGIGLIGGDTTATPGPLAIAIAAWGEAAAAGTPRRSGARPGDALYVTGTIGDAALGLKLRQGGGQDWGLTASQAQFLAARYLRPQPRLELASAIAAHASASLDVSDGLLLDLSRLCRASGASARLEAAAVPLSPAARAAIASRPALLEAALTGGDDYEILLTIRAGAETAFEAAAALTGIPAARIGTITEGDAIEAIGPDGKPLAFAKGGYEHFA